MSRLALVGATFPDEEFALRIGRCLVEERLAACCNVALSRSVYCWEGAVEEAAEATATFKTTPALAGRLATRLAELHPYELPAVEWVLAETTDAVAAWIEESVSVPVS